MKKILFVIFFLSFFPSQVSSATIEMPHKMALGAPIGYWENVEGHYVIARGEKNFYGMNFADLKSGNLTVLISDEIKPSTKIHTFGAGSVIRITFQATKKTVPQKKAAEFLREILPEESATDLIEAVEERLQIQLE